MDIQNIDLCSWSEGEVRKMMAVALCEPGWHSNSYPTKGGVAGKEIARELQAKFPEVFPAIKDAEAWFLMTHFRNMHFKQNSAGQQYP